MEAQSHSIRLITGDHEDFITWPQGTEYQSILEVLVYIKDLIRKKHQTDDLIYKDIEDAEFTIEKLAETEQSPVFISLPNKPDVVTDKSVEPRSTKNTFTFKDPQTVKIEKFENFKKFEEVQFKVPVIKTLNDTNKKRNFAAESERALAKQKIISQGKLEPLNSPVNFVSAGVNKMTLEENYSPASLLNDDMTKRQKVPLHGNDGKSQWSFLKMAQPGSEQTNGKVEIKAYTLEDVKKHNRRQDAWMIIDDKVYDITNYIPFHPGGDKILAGVGRDGTELFNKYHPWVNAPFLLGKYLIGYLKK